MTTDAEYDGHDLMGEVFDLMRERLPRLAPGDPHRPVISWFLPELGPRLGRHRVTVAGERMNTAAGSV